MPNRNYQAGRRLEYEVMEYWRERDYTPLRTAGSHGLYDVIAIRYDRQPEFVQCKRVERSSDATRRMREFKENTVPSKYYHQVMMVKIKGSSDLLTVTV